MAGSQMLRPARVACDRCGVPVHDREVLRSVEPPTACHRAYCSTGHRCWRSARHDSRPRAGSQPFWSRSHSTCPVAPPGCWRTQP